MKTHTSLQRVQDAIARKTPDKVPFHSYHSPEFAMRNAGRQVHEMYLDPEMYLETMCDTIRLCRDDYVSVRLDPWLIVELLEKKYESREFGTLDDLRFEPAGENLLIYHKRNGELLGRIPHDSKTAIPVTSPQPLITSPADINKIEIVPWRELLERPRWQAARRYVDEFQGKRFLSIGIGAASANLLDMYLGTTQAMMAALTDQPFCRAIIDRHFEQLKERVLTAKALGVDGVTTGDACASCSFFSPDIYKTSFFPAHKRIVDFIHTQDLAATLHICGKISPILEDMADTGADIIEGLDPVSAGGDIDLRDAKQRIGDRVCLKGNIDAVHVIEPGPAEAVYQTSMEALEAAGPGSYILSTEQITRDTPAEHVLAMVQARDDHFQSGRSN